MVCLSEQIFQLAEKAREKLGMNRSAFYRHCILSYLESKSLLSTYMKEKPSFAKKKGDASK